MNVQKLRDISECQSHMISIDSSMRDKTHWPTPSEYCIHFDRPFQNVVGYDILDATLPNNTYVVDVHNNRVGFGLRVDGTEAETTTPQYIEMFAGSATFERVMNNADPSLSEIKVIGDNDVFSNAVASSTSNRHLAYFETVGIVQYNTPFSGQAAPVSEKIEVRLSGSYEWKYANRGTWVPLPTINISGTDYGIIKLSNGKTYYADALSLLDIPLSDKVEESGTSITGYISIQVTSSHYDSQVNYYHEWQLHNFDIETGDHDIDTLVATIGFYMPSFQIGGAPPSIVALNLEGTSQVSPLNYRRRRKIVYRSQVYFWMDMNRSSAKELLGFNERTVTTRTAEYERVDFGTHLFGSISESSGVNKFAVYTPGLIDLQGTRFVKLRCPEIEEHRNQINHGDFAPGIGVFKLYNTILAHLRFDYNNFRALTTHPIAKLSRMTLRFETLDGTAYDFKGSDHHFLMVIRTLQPGT